MSYNQNIVASHLSQAKSKRGKKMNQEYLQESYAEWLQALGYSESVIYYYPKQIREFLSFLEANNIHQLENITEAIGLAYKAHLTTRNHQRRKGTLSTSYLNKNLGIVKSFGKFTKEIYGIVLPLSIIIQEKATTKNTIVLTVQEIKQLYRAIKTDALGQRDRAMLGIYYGCGLRRSEGEQLNLTDINLNEKLLLVKKGKNNKERIVPFTENIRNDFSNYLDYGRKQLLNSLWSNNNQHESFLVSRKGNRASAGNIYSRLKKLALIANIDKKIGLHTLRHSIATHLLQQEMELESIQYFLGHSSLESTQTYMHIANE